MDKDKLKLEIIDILKQYPNGLKARDIASKKIAADKTTINSILYNNPNLFVATDYVWKLKTPVKADKSSIPKKLVSRTNSSTPNKLTLQKKPSSPNKTPSIYTGSFDSISYFRYIPPNVPRINFPDEHLIIEAVENEKKINLYGSRSLAENRTHKKCIGNCATCRRDKCVEED